MWLEIFGPPGVGKSRFRKQLLAADKFKLELVANCKAARIEQFAAKPMYWDLCQEVIKLYQANSTSGWRTTGGPPAFMRRLERVITAARSPLCVVLDEGLLQAALSYSYAIGHDERLVREFVQLLPIPRTVVVCNAQPQTILDRNVKRGKSGGNDRGHDALNCLPVIPAIVDEIEKRGRKVFHADLDRDIARTLRDFRTMFNASV